MLAYFKFMNIQIPTYLFKRTSNLFRTSGWISITFIKTNSKNIIHSTVKIKMS